MKHTHLTVFIHNGLLSQLQKGILNKFQNAECTPRLEPTFSTLPSYYPTSVPRLPVVRSVSFTITTKKNRHLHFFVRLKDSFFKMSVFSFLLFAHINDTNIYIKAQNNVNHKAAGVQKVNVAYGVQEYSIGNER